ncbi:MULTISPECIES: hypothetical protein [Wohlfahrtiimonas]|uniref:hypothetical protein n=1 Tax=Wohlfahrtiimonas TaxID=582472 RepID=UPI00037B38E9|nr:MULTISPECIES: hypothetical protein [Wohlfahrtiimonas]MBS7815868.1 hypothetical protein [Wohlfahrtiimonas chitiniclastica]MBS7822137.1 hypothetical protein [Wohlfahrtiimonas chitiniclastica]MBS7825538.1 hypothetical protein [Wohlfahrtiimonas chitiniclastica]MBS7829929.1 hypothetical protein [Wohlfahrtiimonas chitiniclastica]MBS7831896.1 hypothetical protein [Wohlfahrtiimonas chitiniclastica]
MKNKLFTSEQRSEQVRVSITKSELNQLRNIANREKRPVATVAHALLKKAIEEYSCK